MPTSGTVNTYPFSQRSFIDMALRRGGYLPEKASSEWIQIAQDCMFLQLSEYVNAGFPLWTREFRLLSCGIGNPDVVCPDGTVDVITSYWRILNPFRGNAMTSQAVGANVLFAGQPSADMTITGANPGVTALFGSSTEVDTIGVLLGGTTPITAALNVLVSQDNAAFTLAQTLPSATYTPGKWTYFNLNPSVQAPFVQLQYAGASSWTLNQLNFGLANGQDIEIGALNIDDYYDTPNKYFQSARPNSAWLDRKIDAPVIKIWPTLNTEGFYNGTVGALMRRYIQDPGKMTDNLEIPTRWYNGVVSRLAVTLMDSLPEDDGSTPNPFMAQQRQQRRTNNDTVATKSEAMMWAEERSHGPIRIAPNISGYTR